MVLVTFRVTVREDVDQEAFHHTAGRMMELVSAMPGFKGIEWYGAVDDPRTQLALAVFDSHETIAEWKNNPEHLVAQKRGREEFFAGYRLQIADISREYSYPKGKK
ncbi:MAG: antibiotic biosynthesis monooxygenase [Actinomycetota bacterium]|nr:antibiotic biosynthesis monooxygenase [Actinomycetota bacterium]